MKINKELLKFPKILPNDLEAFLVFYPAKFPGIVSYYESVAKKIADNPKAFSEYGYLAHDELFKGFEKIKHDYKNGNQNDLDFLVSIDQRFHKLICYRFWIVNYLFPDWPIHDFYVDVLKNSIRKFVDIDEEVEEFDNKIIQIQRDLLQSDYADLYLQQALNGIKVLFLLEEDIKTKTILHDATILIDEHSQKNINKINMIWDNLIKLIKTDSCNNSKQLKEELYIPFEQAKFRKTMVPIYNMLTHAVEFREENKKLKERYKYMKQKLDNYFEQAKQKLTKEEFELFEIAYLQTRNFAMFKDVMWEIDSHLLPLWFGLLRKIKKILSKTNPNMQKRGMGHCGIFYYLIWYLPPEIKAKVITPDFTPFSLENL